jgi:1-acyl-sn-glycerol-3-phosphate acyltransferase
MSPWLADRWWDLGKVACFYTFTTLFSLRTHGGQYIPRSGPLLILANHQSFFDPVLAGLGIPRYIRWVARQTLHKNRYLAALINSLRAIPIEHHGYSREGLQAITDALEAGNCVGMFPEGTRTPDGEVKEFKPGLSLIIKRTKAPIVPVGIAGAFAAWPRTTKLPRPSPIFMPPTNRTIGVSVGRPIDPTKFAKTPREKMLEELRQAVCEEKERAERLRRQ